MLSPRYTCDHKPIREMNDLQLQTVQQVEEKIRLKRYPFETVPCALCQAASGLPLAGKDRYGLYFPVVICRNCGLVQTNPRMTAEAYRSFYAEEYRKLYLGRNAPTETFFQQQYRHGKQIMAYLRRKRAVPLLRPDPLVLEVGCGAGGILKCFRDQGCRVKGLDLDTDYLAYGRDVHGLDLVHGTLADYPAGDPPDLIIYSHVMEHLLDPPEEMRRAHHVLADHGRLYVEVPSIKNLWGNYSLDFLRYLQNAHTYHFTLRTLTQLMNRQGFNLLTGDEGVRSVFTKAPPGEPPSPLTNDFADAMRYLNRAEKWRPLVPEIIHRALRSYRYRVGCR